MLYGLVRKYLYWRYETPLAVHEKVLKWSNGLQEKTQEIDMLKRLMKSFYTINCDELKVNYLNLVFPNPVGLAAGFDKGARIVDLFECFGFGFVEIGSILFLPNKGNPEPLIEIYPEERALVNNLGLPSEGAMAVYSRLANRKASIPVGANIAAKGRRGDYEEFWPIKRTMSEYVKAYETMAMAGVDYITINISCPNTPDGKTFEEPSALEDLLSEIMIRDFDIPIFIKISADNTYKNLEKIMRIGTDKYAIHGYVIANTKKVEKGGLSGEPIREQTTQLIRHVYNLTNGQAFIIGVGGIFNAEHAYQKIKAGANTVQVLTGMVMGNKGWAIAKSINQGLLKLMERDGLTHISQARGVESDY